MPQTLIFVDFWTGTNYKKYDKKENSVLCSDCHHTNIKSDKFILIAAKSRSHML